MRKITLLLALFVLCILPVINAAWVEPVDCEKLLNKEFEPKTEFTEEEAFCFYGSGYGQDEQVIVSLENEQNTISKEYKTTSGGILTSIKSFMTGLISGVYDLFVRGETTVKYSEKITVGGEPEIPEFTTIAAGIVLFGAALIIKSQRSKNG